VGGFQRALLASSVFLGLAALVGLRTTNAGAEQQPPLGEVPESAPA
jgi:hypothetical protein